MKYCRSLTLIFLLFAALACFSEGRTVTVLTLDGPIDPISSRYVQRGLDQAARDGAALAVIEMDTPGGLSVSMDQIVARILSSSVPVAVYVWPRGARAASAGVFIAMAAQIAAMAPGTHIGAAHPVVSGGEDIPGTMGTKVLNDTLAKLKSLAQLRHRNVDWADQAVRRSMSLTETEAVSRRVVDFSANDLEDLLKKVDGRTVDMPRGTMVLHTIGAEERPFTLSFIDRFLGFLVNPDIAYILLIIGMFGIIFELSHPGLVAPGIAGGIALLLAFISFGSLPTNLGGILFIVLAIVLFILDIKLPTHGVLTAGGIASFVLGSFLLFPPWRMPRLPAAPVVRVDPVLIGTMTVLVSAFFIFIVSKGLLAQRRRPTSGTESLPGATGVALTEMAPDGLVQSMGEQWSSRSVEGTIHAGENIEVVGREGLRLLVRRRPEHSRRSDMNYLLIAVIVVLVIIILSASIKVVREYQRLVVFRLGRSVGARGPGLVFLIPIVDKPVWTDLRELYLEIPSQTCITKDNAPIDIDFLIYWRVMDPSLSVIQVANFAGASQGIATTTLRAVIGDIPLDDVLSKREDINRVLRTKLDEVTERWGVKVTTVEIREIVPPKDIQDAMNRQMSAERNRRAMIIESEGKRQSAILVAEGEKQSAILKAEGDRQAAILRAEGFALALEKIFGTAKTVDSKTMMLQYFDTLKQMGTGAATKFIFPMEFMSMLKPLVGIAEEAVKKQGG